MTQPRLSAFAHLSAENADLYRAILEVFSAAREQFEIHLRPSDLRRALQCTSFAAIGEDDLGASLTQLTKWHNLTATRDTADVATVEEFYRARFLYQLTAEGEAAESALRLFAELLSRPGELQTTALRELIGILEANRSRLSCCAPCGSGLTITATRTRRVAAASGMPSGS